MLDSIVTPAHTLLLPIDNFKLLNFLNFNDVGNSPLNESVAFKKTKMFSKTLFYNLISAPTSYLNRYRSISFCYVNDNVFLDSMSYGLKRQHNFASSSSLVNNFSTFFGLRSVFK
jgi:hypothetical protein